MTRMGASDPDFRLSWPLDMVAPLSPDAEAAGGLLLGRWADLSIGDLPTSAQRVALSAHPSWRAIAAALVEPATVGHACDEFASALRNRLMHSKGERAAAISLARAGLTSDTIPKFEELGREWNLTRERVRQLASDVQADAHQVLDWRAPICLVIGAHFALNPRTPLLIDSLEPPQSARGRVLRLTIETIGLPQPKAPFTVWTQTLAQSRAVEAVLAVLPAILPRARTFPELAELVAEALPHIDETLDLAATLSVLATTLDFGPGLDGRFALSHARLVRRVADKTVTYLQRRAAPITPSDLADAIRRGVPPFEPLHRPLVDAEWITECARRSPKQLQLLQDGRIALARRLSHLRPTGNIAILHAIVGEHGEPMRMVDLCDRAAHYGMSRNQVGVFIHSGRAACLFMLTRGIVGLVGRDEMANPADYQAAHPGLSPRTRVGQEIGFDSAGRIAADVAVRRSVREQGFALPWPFNILHFSNTPELEVGGAAQPIVTRANGDLDLAQLNPGDRVRLRLTLTLDGHRLTIEFGATDPITLFGETNRSTAIQPGLASLTDRPGWVDLVLHRAGPQIAGIGDLASLLPSGLPPRRRLRALYAIAALGLVHPSDHSLVARPQRQLPYPLADVYAILRDDPTLYAVLPPASQSAASWLVRATWLVPNVGWTRVRANDLADSGAEDDDEGGSTHVATSPRETALMRIVEAAHQAADLVHHPGEIDGVAATRNIVRRYLTALGYTAYNAVRDVASLDGEALSVHPATTAAATALWLLLPIGAGINEADVRRADRATRTTQVDLTVITDGLTLIVGGQAQPETIDLRTIGRNSSQFDQLCTLAADPPSLIDQAG